jgi:hypothetical protein
MSRSAETAVREQAAQLATAWSGAGAPSSWSLTAALFATLRDDLDLLALAARIDPDRLPALLFAAAVMALRERQRPEPLARVLPQTGKEQPPLPPDFAAELRAFCPSTSARARGSRCTSTHTATATTAPTARRSSWATTRRR